MSRVKVERFFRILVLILILVFIFKALTGPVRAAEREGRPAVVVACLSDR